MTEWMVVDSDGIERPGFTPVSTTTEFKYTDIGRVMAHGRAAMVKNHNVVIGTVFSFDDEWYPNSGWYASPDNDAEYSKRRWVGAFKTRKEATQFLRAIEHVNSDWWNFER